MIFKDRQDAGQQLAQKLLDYKGKKNVIVLGLPRGGVVNAFEVSKGLNLPLDVLVPRKIGAPGFEEVAIGAITMDGAKILDQEAIKMYNISPDYIAKEIKAEGKEAKRRLEKFRGSKPPLDLKNMTAIIVDDGIATGATMRAAIQSAKIKGASKVIVAVPTLASESIDLIESETDQLIYLDAPPSALSYSVGQWYKDFAQTEDDEVVEILKNANG